MRLFFAAAALLWAASPAAANSVSFRVSAHVPLACWVTAEGPRCNAPPAPGQEAAEGFVPASVLAPMAPRFENGAQVLSFVAH